MLSAVVFITLIAGFVHGQTLLELPKLSYAYNEIEPVISERTMRLHHDGHYYGYINKTNAALKALFEETAKESNVWREIVKLPIEVILTRLSELPPFYNDALRHQGGGYLNHKLYFSILRKPVAKADDNRPTGPVFDAIVKSFASYEKFQQYFTEASMGVFGSGWVWLYIDAKTGQLVLNYTAYQDNPIMFDKNHVVILGIDLWEHAYYLNYENRRKEYIDNFWRVINWERVSELFMEGSKKRADL